MQRLAALRRDLRLAVRTLSLHPGFAAVVVLTLGLGIGVNTAVFSAVNALMFRPLPVPGAERLVVLATSTSTSAPLRPMSYADIQDHRAAAKEVVEDIAGYSVGFIGLTPHGSRPVRVLVSWVTANYFELLGIRPALGRLVGGGEGAAGRVDRIVVLGYTTWQRRFGGDPTVIGRAVRLNGRPCTIVGVAPREFAGTFAFSESEVYLPINWAGDFPHAERGARSLHAIARLGAGVTIERAQAIVDVAAARLRTEHPDTNAGVAVHVLPERLARPEENNARSNRLAAIVILGLVGLVLLVADVNVTSLLVARLAGRRREFAVRAALGASPGRLLQHVLAESAVLSVLGGIAGIALGAAAARALGAVRLPGDLPVRFDFQLDYRVWAYALVLTAATALTIGLAGVRRAARASVDQVLRGDGHGSTRASSGVRGRRVLVVGQVAVTVALTLAGALFARSFWEARSADLGFRPEHVLNVQMDVAQLGYAEARGRAFFAEVERRVRQLPEVEDVSYAFSVPFGYVSLSTRLEAEDRPMSAGEQPVAGKNIVGTRYCSTLGIRIESGRAFSESDDGRGPRVAIVNRQLAALLWPGQNPIGRRFREVPGEGTWLEVVGVTSTGKYRQLFESPQPYFYVPIAQEYTGLRALHVKARSAPEAIAPAVELVIRGLEPDLPLYDVQGMTQALDGGNGRFLVQVAALFATVLALLAVLLTGVGLYGVVSYVSRERTHEIGVRLALGASPSSVAALVVGEAARLLIAGGVTGMVVAYGATRVLQGLLFGVEPADAISIAFALACLVVVTGVATWGPARWAARVDPMRALRAD